VKVFPHISFREGKGIRWKGENYPQKGGIVTGEASLPEKEGGKKGEDRKRKGKGTLLGATAKKTLNQISPRNR